MVESPLVGPFRASHLGDMIRWTGESISEDIAFEFGDLQREQYHGRKLWNIQRKGDTVTDKIPLSSDSCAALAAYLSFHTEFE